MQFVKGFFFFSGGKRQDFSHLLEIENSLTMALPLKNYVKSIIVCEKGEIKSCPIFIKLFTAAMCIDNTKHS